MLLRASARRRFHKALPTPRATTLVHLVHCPLKMRRSFGTASSSGPIRGQSQLNPQIAVVGNLYGPRGGRVPFGDACHF
jgi:hypothetical protein